MATRHPGYPSPAAGLGDALDVLAGLIAVGLLVLVDRHGSGPSRLLLTLGFTLFVPGRAIVSNWPGMARWSEAAMPMVFSLAVLTLLAMIMLCARMWHPVSLFQAEAWLSLAGLCAGAARRHGHRRRPGAAARQTRQWPRRKNWEKPYGKPQVKSHGNTRGKLRQKGREDYWGGWESSRPKDLGKPRPRDRAGQEDRGTARQDGRGRPRQEDWGSPRLEDREDQEEWGNPHPQDRGRT